MKSIQIPRTVACLATAFFISHGPAWAGFSSERLGITHVPIGGEGATKAGLIAHEEAGTAYPALEEPLTVVQIAQLSEHKDFEGRTSEEIQEKIVSIRRAILCAIEMLSKSDPETAEGLQRLYRNGMIGVGIAPEDYRVNSAIRDDGKKEFNLEPINLYNPPCSPSGTNYYVDGLPGQFELINDLANLGLYARQEAKGPRDGSPLEVQLDTQCRQVAAAEAEVARITKMQSLISFVAVAGSVPLGVDAMELEVAYIMLRLRVESPPLFFSILEIWQDTLLGMKLKAENRKSYWEREKRATELQISDQLVGDIVREQLRQRSLFVDYGIDHSSGLRNRWYFSEVSEIDESGANPFVSSSNFIIQYGPWSTSSERFAVIGLDTICAGYVWEEEMKAFIGGIKLGTGGAADEGRVFTFDLDNRYRIRPETARLSFGTTEMGTGYTMGFNSFDECFYAFQPGNGFLCKLEDTNNDKEPDSPRFAGQFITGSFSLRGDLRYSYFSKADTAVAFEYGFDVPLRYDSRVAVSWGDPGMNFMPQPDEKLMDSLCERPGFDGRVDVGSQYLPLKGTPYSNFNLYDRGTMIAQGCFSPYGFAYPHLTNPLSEDSELRIEDEKTGSESVRIRPSISYGIRPMAEIVEDNDYDLSLGVRYELDPKFRIRLEYGDTVEGIDDSTTPLGFVPRAGFGYLNLEGSESRTRFVRAVGGPQSGIVPQPDNFEMTPGLVGYFDVSKNDNVPPAARFELTEAPLVFGLPLTETGFKFFPDGTFYISFSNFCRQPDFIQVSHVCVVDYVSPEVCRLYRSVC